MKKWMIGLVVVGVLGVGWWLVSPLFLDKVVNEAPVMSDHSNMNEEEENTMEEKDAMSGDSKMDQEDMNDDTMEEQDDMKDETMEETDSSSSDDMTKDTMKTDELMGTFSGADSGHTAKGSVMVSDKNIRLEDFEVTNGPDLYVYLVEEGQETKDGVSLGELKGNMGNQNYEVPKGESVSAGMKIVIWCKQFNVDFGSAELGSKM
ncbi:DM13 domain-containing protein [Bacillus sp. BHET2]|uniref:DM13 domain-containing protein n=1 Tax=Bacillus sp. BHET2 TaxID=2583818 RepID=UPI00148717BD|nr:DM13 domain-containing protein [Bacillus sp. BHET2]